MKRLLLLCLVLFVGNAWSGASDFIFLEGKVVSFDDQYVEITTSKKPLKIAIKDLASDQVRKWKMNEYVSLKVASKNYIPK